MWHEIDVFIARGASEVAVEIYEYKPMVSSTGSITAEPGAMCIELYPPVLRRRSSQVWVTHRGNEHSRSQSSAIPNRTSTTTGVAVRQAGERGEL